MDFDVKRDVYDLITKKQKVRDYVYELDTHHYNQKGERVDPEEKTAEQVADIEFKNHVYEMVFQDLEILLKEEYKKKVAEQKLKAKQPKPVKAIKKKQKVVDEYGEELEDEYGEEQEDIEDDEPEEEDDEMEEELIA